MDIPDTLSPLLPIVHRLRIVFRATSRILTELLYVCSGRPDFARPYVGVHMCTSLMSSSLLLQQCPACLGVQSDMSARPALKFKPGKSPAFENLELFKELDPSTQFPWERISSTVQLIRSLRGSEAESTISSRYSSFRGRERSLDPGRLRRTAWHIGEKTVFRPSAYVDLQSLGLTGGEEKFHLPFVSTPRPLSRIGPSMQVFQQSQWLSRSGIPRPPIARTYE